jgi:hypothetical protein
MSRLAFPSHLGYLAFSYQLCSFCSLVIMLLLSSTLICGASYAATLPAGFQEETVFTGLSNPTAIEFASDGRIFVAEKRGVIKVFDSLSDTTPTVFADLRTNVYNFWDRGLLASRSIRTLRPIAPMSMCSMPMMRRSVAQPQNGELPAQTPIRVQTLPARPVMAAWSARGCRACKRSAM